jgi:hypothetical protein
MRKKVLTPSTPSNGNGETSKEETAKAQPTKLDDVDRLEMVLWNERLNHTRTAAVGLQAQMRNLQDDERIITEKRNEIARRVQGKYQLGQSDSFDPETGAITRGPKSEAVPASSVAPAAAPPAGGPAPVTPETVH